MGNTTLWSKRLIHYNFLRTKSKFGAVTDINVKFTQGTSPVYIISSFTNAPQSTCRKIVPLLNVNG